MTDNCLPYNRLKLVGTCLLLPLAFLGPSTYLISSAMNTVLEYSVGHVAAPRWVYMTEHFSVGVAVVAAR